MKWIGCIALAFGLMGLTTCSVGSQANAYKERREALQARTINARSYADFLRARYASLTNDPEQAALYYAGAVRSNPYDHDLLERAVFSSLIAGRMEVAVAISQNAKDITLAQTSLPRLILGIEALKADQPRKAERILLPETSSLFNDAISRNLIAWSLVASNKQKEALAILDATDNRDGLLQGLSQSTRALIQLNSGDEAAALETFEEMWQANNRLATSTEYHARLLAKSGESDKALRLLRHFSNRIGQNAAIEALRSDIKAGEQITLPPPSLLEGAALSVYMPAAALASQTRSDLAGVYFSLALSLDPNLDIARTLWGNSLDQADRREDAIATLQGVPKTSVFYATAQGQIAWALRREDRNEEALKTAREALAYAEDRNLKIQLGDLFRSLEQIEQAERVFSEIIAEDAKESVEDWRLFYARGAAREQLDRWPEAEADLLRAKDMAPNQPALLNYLGYSWIDRDIRLDEGFELIKNAVALRPNAGFIIDSYGWAFYKRGNFSEAVKHLERAVELEPNNPTLNDHLGDAYWRVGRKLEAGFQWNRTIRLDPDAENIPHLRAKIEDGLDRANAHKTAKQN